MYGLPCVSERLETLEDDIDVLHGCSEIEDGLERRRVETRSDLRIGADEPAEVALLVPRLHCVALHDPVCSASVEARTDKREQQPVREDESVRRVDVAAHPLRI